MAIFGKKKSEKDKQQVSHSMSADSTSSLSPIIDSNVTQKPGAPQQSRELSGIAAPSSLSHDSNKGSISGPASAGMALGFAVPTSSSGLPLASNQPAHMFSRAPASNQPTHMFSGALASNQPAHMMAGPPGAANGFKFGGANSRPDGSASDIPASGSNIRSRKTSQDSSPGHAGYGMGGIVGTGLNGSISGLPPSSSVPHAGMPISSSIGSVPTEKGRTQQVVYPWSQKTLVMNPPKFLDQGRQAPPGALSPFPFPRYGHAANQNASPTGEIYLFGGLVRESVKNDLYTIYVDKLVNPTSPTAIAPSPSQLYASATLVQTTGEIPPPRVGHATILVSNVLILWGGDTKVRADDRQDEGLYLLNLSTREWTRVKAASDSPDACPAGRYGHTVSIVGSRFYVFGGQVDGTFLNDLWSFDLNSLKTTPTWEIVTPSSELPPKRTGHSSVTHKDKIYIFGGTDGQYHYNDTWCYDITTNAWKELSCIGYIPVPREGHATCLVDDIMYIFGGRGVDGKDLGDLASFRITNQRWYMFANMGPSPSGRSGHALATYQNKVIVLGGESFTGAKPDDPSIIHVLDTGKIKYPPDNPSQQQPQQPQQQQQRSGNNSRKSSLPAGTASGSGQQTAGPPSSIRSTISPVAEEDPRRAISPTQRSTQRGPAGYVSPGFQERADSPYSSQRHVQQQQQQQPMQLMQQTAQQQQQQHTQQPSGLQTAENLTRSMSPTAQTVREQRAAALYGSQAQVQSMAGMQPQSQIQSQPQPQPQSQLLHSQQSQGPLSYSAPRNQRSIENLRGGGSTSPTGGSTLRSLNGVLGKIDSPSSAATPDGFYQNRNPSPPGVSGYSTVHAHAYAQPQPQPQSASAEVETLRKREAWLKAALALAIKKGFVEPEQIQIADGTTVDLRSASPDRLSLIDGIDTGAEGSDRDRILKTLISLKAQLASARATIAQQAQGGADRLAESDRARSAAMQEAGYYRAKLSALETNNINEATRLDRERAAKFEKALADALRENAQLDRQVASLREQAKLEQRLRTSAEERLSETAKRAMSAEAAQMKAYDELSSLQKRSYTTESTLREYSEQVATLSSMAARHKADHEHVRSQLDSAKSDVGTHLVALTELQAAHSAVTSRATEYERIHSDQRNLIQQHQGTVNELKAQLEVQSSEARSLLSRVTELETLLAQHRQDAETHRIAATGGLAALLSLKDQQSVNRDAGHGSIPAHVSEKVRALEDEAESMRQLHSEARQMADKHANALQELQEYNLSVEKQQSGLRFELGAMRSQLAIALQEVARLKDVSSSKDLELRDRNRAVEAAQVKASLLKQFMADRGVSIPNDDELSVKSGYADRRIRELEDEIDARSRELQDVEHRLQDSESRVEEMTRELEHQASRQASQGVSPGDLSLVEAQQRAESAEHELAETTASYKERMAQLETDYQTAVQFVKGTEKMLRRMKDELTKYKTENATLQSEVAALRSGNMADDETASEEAARDIEALRNRLADVTNQNEEIAVENRELERKLAQLITEQRDAHERNKDAEINHAGSSRKIVDLEKQVSKLEVGLSEARTEVQETLELNQHLSNELATVSKDRPLAGGAASNGDGASLSRSQSLVTVQNANEQLKRENTHLTQRLHEVEDKFQLLLGRMESTHDGGEDRIRDSIAYGSITSELDKWERDRSLGDNDAFGLGNASGTLESELLGLVDRQFGTQPSQPHSRMTTATTTSPTTPTRATA